MSSDSPAITAEGLGKRYRLGVQASYGRLTETLSRLPSMLRSRTKTTDPEFWALKDVDLTVPQGEVLGLIGRNGSGKSTLLKILSRVTRPTLGTATLRGQVGSLLEVGTGFHPELTGRENVYLSGAILGMNKRDIQHRFDEIVEFADVGRFLDTPVKRFSSGMQVRLGFAVAAHLDTEILLVDEVLAVGDVEFQQKCLDRMEKAGNSGRTIVLVSHNPAAVSRLCTTTVVLESGRVSFQGPTEDALRRYLSGADDSGSWASDQPAGSGDRAFGFLSAAIQGGDSIRGTRVSGHDPLVVDISYEVGRHISGLMVGLALHHQSGSVVLETYEFDGIGPSALERGPGVYQSRCHFPAGFLNAGTYWLSLVAFEHNVDYLHVEPRAIDLEVWEAAVPGAEYSMNRGGVIAPNLHWELT